MPKELKERGWINEREEKKPGKGRPHKIYSLKVMFNNIIAQLEKQQKKAVEGIGQIITLFFKIVHIWVLALSHFERSCKFLFIFCRHEHSF
ncbi:MAG: hypothetical protein O8C62_08950 [Candidatus Methanoperedens sp.]|nr:hypothetical protein [Candidatus Methanoperedens sp.]